MRWIQTAVVLGIGLILSQGSVWAQCKGMSQKSGGFGKGSPQLSGGSSFGFQSFGRPGLGIPQGSNYNNPQFGFSLNNPQFGFGLNTPQLGYGSNLPQYGFGYKLPQTGLNFNSPLTGYLNPLGNVSLGNPLAGANLGTPLSATTLKNQLALQQAYAVLTPIVLQLQRNQITGLSMQALNQDLIALQQINQTTTLTPDQKNLLALQVMQKSALDLQNLVNEATLPAAAQSYLGDAAQRIQQLTQVAQ